MSYGSRKIGSDAGPSGGETLTDDQRRPWLDIQRHSILAFVKEVSRRMGCRDYDAKLWRALADSALYFGRDVRYRGITYTPAMQLDMYARREGK